MPITSLLELRLRPDALEGAPAAIGAILAQTRAREGNEGLEVVVDVTDPTHWTVIEHWASIEADDAYRSWRETPEGATSLGDLLAAPPTLTRYEVRSTV